MEIFVGVVFLAAFFYFIVKAGQKQIIKIKHNIVDAENKVTGETLSINDIKFFSMANCAGSYTKGPGGFNAHICGIGSAIYIRSLTKVMFRIETNSIINFDLFEPFVPYIMTINAAAILANEMTRREFGNSVLIEFIDEYGELKEIQLGQFKGQTAEALVTHIELVIGRGAECKSS